MMTPKLFLYAALGATSLVLVDAMQGMNPVNMMPQHGPTYYDEMGWEIQPIVFFPHQPVVVSPVGRPSLLAMLNGVAFVTKVERDHVWVQHWPIAVFGAPAIENPCVMPLKIRKDHFFTSMQYHGTIMLYPFVSLHGLITDVRFAALVPDTLRKLNDSNAQRRFSRRSSSHKKRKKKSKKKKKKNKSDRESSVSEIKPGTEETSTGSGTLDTMTLTEPSLNGRPAGDICDSTSSSKKKKKKKSKKKKRKSQRESIAPPPPVWLQRDPVSGKLVDIRDETVVEIGPDDGEKRDSGRD